MRVVGLGLIGFVGGGLLGLVLAYLAVVLLFDVLGVFSHGADGMSGLAAMLILAPLLALTFGIGGVFLAIHQTRAEAGSGVVWGAIGLIVPVLALAFGGLLFGFL